MANNKTDRPEIPADLLLPIKEVPKPAEEKAARAMWKSRAIEEVKAMGLLNQLCTYITTLKLKNSTDQEIVEQINILFSFTAKRISTKEWPKILQTYPDILKAYLRGTLDHNLALTAFMGDYLIDYFSTHKEDANNAVKLHKNLLDASIEQQKIQAVQNISSDALKVSQTTSETLTKIQQSLLDAEQPDFDAPAAEDEEWARMQREDNA